MGAESDTETQTGVDRRQLLLVSLCLVGLVLAAFLAPPELTPNGSGFGDGTGASGGEFGDSNGEETNGERGGGEASGGNENGDSEGEGGDEVDGDDGGDGSDSNEGVRTADGDSFEDRPDDDGGVVGGGSDPVPIPGGDAPPVEDGCGVIVEHKPVPGQDLTVRVYQDLDEASETRVWFNDRFVGRTDQNGQVTGTVPFQRSLNVTVESPGSEPCEFFRRPYEDGQSDASASLSARESAASDPESGFSESLETRVTGLRQSTVGAVSASLPGATSRSVGGGGAAGQQRESGNSTGRYGVYGTVNVTVTGDPYPDSQVTVRATIDGEPIQDATVSVGDETVGQTDESGRYRLTVPDRDTAMVTVARGEFNGSKEIDVWQLDVRIEPGEGLPVPGEPARVTATINDRPVEGATVTLGDSRLGTTGPDGTVAFELPSDMGATVTASTSRQTATASMLSVYWSTILLSLVLLIASLVTVAFAAVAYSFGAAKKLAGYWFAVDVVYAASVLWEHEGLAISLAAVALVTLFRFRSSVQSGGESAAGLLVSIVSWTRRTVLRIVSVLERFLDWVIVQTTRLAGWLRSLPLSISELATRLWRWLLSLGRRFVGWGRAVLTARTITAGGLAGAVLTAAHMRWGTAGSIGTAGLIVLSGLVALYWLRDGPPSESSASDRSAPHGTGGTESRSAEQSLPSLRDLWRGFARLVVPGGWRTRTPGEVSRVAIDRGFPRRPVEVLTEAFREVEYGGQPSDSRRERAGEAYEELVDVPEREDADE